MRAWDERIEDVDLDDVGALIPMGGNAHAWDEQAVPLMRSERLLLEKAVERGGAGARGLPRCPGPHARPGRHGHEAAEPERGWLEIVPTEAAADDPLFGHLEKPTGVYQWHDDVFEPPPGARSWREALRARIRLSGSTARTPGASSSIPRPRPELWELWIARHPVEVAEAGVDVEALRHEVHEGADASLGFRTTFFDAFIGRVRDRWHA